MANKQLRLALEEYHTNDKIAHGIDTIQEKVSGEEVCVGGGRWDVWVLVCLYIMPWRYRFTLCDVMVSYIIVMLYCMFILYYCQSTVSVVMLWNRISIGLESE